MKASAPTRTFVAGVALCTAALLAFLLAKLHTWPPHEDETLALFVGRGSLPQVVASVVGTRGGAPLHFLLASLVAHAGGGLTGLRLVSALFAAASVPLVALLGARLAGRAAGLGAAVLASASWLVLFNGVYGRMYSLFLCTSALAYLAALSAAEHGGRRRWVLWVAAILLCLASHPYGALVLAAQAAWLVAVARPRRDAGRAVAAAVLLAAPFWYADAVLRGRFGVGVGGGGGALSGIGGLPAYLWLVVRDASSGIVPAAVISLALAAVGLVDVRRRRPREAALVAVSVAVPVLALAAARLGRSVSPESRHLIFLLPLWATCVANGVVVLARPLRRGRLAAAAVALAALAVAGVAWAQERTPPLFHREAAARVAARAAAAAWVAATARPDDVGMGYDPVFLGAWERRTDAVRFVVPRADPKLAVAALTARPAVGRGVWVIDFGDPGSHPVRETAPRVSLPPSFEVRSFGPYLVVRGRRPAGTARAWLEQAAVALRAGRDLGSGDADVDLHTVLLALDRLRGQSR